MEQQLFLLRSLGSSCPLCGILAALDLAYISFLLGVIIHSVFCLRAKVKRKKERERESNKMCSDNMKALFFSPEEATTLVIAWSLIADRESMRRELDFLISNTWCMSPACQKVSQPHTARQKQTLGVHLESWAAVTKQSLFLLICFAMILRFPAFFLDPPLCLLGWIASPLRVAFCLSRFFPPSFLTNSGEIWPCVFKK